MYMRVRSTSNHGGQRLFAVRLGVLWPVISASGLGKRQEVGVEFFLVRVGQTVRRARLEPLINAAEALPAAPIGTIWSSSPWITRIG